MKTETIVNIETLVRIEGEKPKETNGYKIVKEKENFRIVATPDIEKLSKLLLPKKKKKSSKLRLQRNLKINYWLEKRRKNE